MAKKGKPISDKKLAAIQAEYEAGIETKSNIAKKHRINRLTLLRYAKKHSWSYGKSNKDVTRHITKKATEQIVEKETLKLVDFTEKHIRQLDAVREITNEALSAIKKNLKEAEKDKRDLTKEETEGWFHLQKFCKISSETLAIIYKDERLAMGLGDKESSVNVQVNNIQELDNLSDEELDRIIYGE